MTSSVLAEIIRLRLNPVHFCAADPDAVKPDDWDETEPAEIEDESAEMPTGWLENEPENIPDPDAERPSDW